MAIDLTNKPIAITGASSGIGEATAMACAAAGMPVVLGARRVDRLEKIVERIRTAGGRAIAVKCDVDRPDDCRQLVETTVREFGTLYAIFANAGYGLERSMHEMTDAELRGMFETNFFGTINAIRPALDRIMSAEPPPGTPRGHILICSSCLSKMTVPFYGAYSATKAAQNHIGRAMRLELCRFNIEVTTVHPVGTKTEFFDQVQAVSGIAKLIQHSPDRFMQTSTFVGKQVVKVLRRPRPELWPGKLGKLIRLGMIMGSVFPRITDAFVRRQIDSRLKCGSQKP